MEKFFFGNPGQKIKNWAFIFFVFSLISLLIGSIEVATVDVPYSTSEFHFFLFLLIFVVGFTIIYEIALMTYGLGELVEKTTATHEKVNSINAKVTMDPEMVKQQEIEKALKF